MIEINNRKARYNYEIFETYEAGIVLTGTEVKSIRAGKCNLSDSYGTIRGSEAFILNMHIAEYDHGNRFNHDENRTRKLLFHRSEILKIRDKIKLEGYSFIPLKLYFVSNNAKILFGIAKGRKSYDKREVIKERDIKRDLEKKYKF